MDYVIYTDGSSLNNQCEDRVGGWAALVFKKTKDGVMKAELSGSEEGATNSKMELMGLQKALEIVPPGSRIKVYSDSSYVVNTFNTWVHGWVKKGWKKKKGEIAHLEIVKDIYNNLTKMEDYELIHVKGHDGNKYNEIVDDMAVAAANKCKEAVR
jgi:ribonuclease HI